MNFIFIPYKPGWIGLGWNVCYYYRHCHHCHYCHHCHHHHRLGLTQCCLASRVFASMLLFLSLLYMLFRWRGSFRWWWCNIYIATLMMLIKMAISMLATLTTLMMKTTNKTTTRKNINVFCIVATSLTFCNQCNKVVRFLSHQNHLRWLRPED